MDIITEQILEVHRQHLSETAKKLHLLADKLEEMAKNSNNFDELKAWNLSAGFLGLAIEEKFLK